MAPWARHIADARHLAVQAVEQAGEQPGDARPEVGPRRPPDHRRDDGQAQAQVEGGDLVRGDAQADEGPRERPDDSMTPGIRQVEFRPSASRRSDYRSECDGHRGKSGLTADARGPCGFVADLETPSCGLWG